MGVIHPTPTVGGGGSRLGVCNCLSISAVARLAKGADPACLLVQLMTTAYVEAFLAIPPPSLPAVCRTPRAPFNPSLPVFSPQPPRILAVARPGWGAVASAPGRPRQRARTHRPPAVP